MGWYSTSYSYEYVKPMEMVTHKCGHEDERHIRGRGKVKKEESRIWWAGQNCKECWKAEKEKENEAVNATLPVLVGSEKQVNWAKMLRVKTIAKMEGALLDLKLLPEMEKVALVKVEILKRVKSAKFWIDTRDEEISTIFSHVNKDGAVVTVWFANPIRVPSRHSRGYTYVGGTKPHYTEHELAEVA